MLYRSTRLAASALRTYRVYRSYVSQPSFPQATTPTGETQAKQTSSLSETSNPKSSKTPASDKPNAKQHTTLAETSDPLATAPKSGETQKKHYSTLSETSDSPTTAPQSSEPQSDDKPHATQHSTLAETSDPLATAPLSSEPQATQPTPLAETSDPSATAPNASEAHPTRLAPLYTRSDSSSQAEPPVTPPEASATPSGGKRPAPGTKPGPLKTKPGEPRALIKGTLDKSGPTPHLLTLADLSPHQIQKILKMSLAMKHSFQLSPLKIRQSLTGRTIALMFNKRSTRTRVASETSANALGGSAMFLGSSDVQLGVNETLEDTAKTVGGMADGIMARVGEHDDVETLAKHSPVPVINALSKLYHPTQILADVLTLHEAFASKVAGGIDIHTGTRQSEIYGLLKRIDLFEPLRGKKVAWVGDTNNITNELLVTLPRLGMEMAVASPKGYDKVEDAVWSRVTKSKREGMVTLTNSPEEALHDADVVVTDTWISMGQEEEKAARLAAFEGYQITNKLVESSGAKPDWKFLHCLPRKQEEVDDEVFHGPRSLVFQEAENRKWTIMACFDYLFGQWKLP